LREAQLAVLSGLGRKLRQRLRERKIKSCDQFWGGICAGSLNQENLTRILPLVGPGVNELMCHPGISDDTLRSRYGWGYHWDDEVTALMSDETMEMLQREGIRLAGFGDAWDDLAVEGKE
jgi:chitin disaccharide deacetylase